MSMEPEQPASEGTPPVAAQTHSNSFGRLIGVLFSPNETFAAIARKPDWVVPLLLFMAVALFNGYVFAHHVDFVSAARTQMEHQGKMSADQIDRALKVTAAIAKVVAYCAPIMTVIVFVIVAAILMVAFRMMGGEGEFKSYFSVTLYGWFPQILQALIMTIILMLRSEPYDAELLPTLLRSNLGFLVDMHDHRVLFGLLSSLDIFTIWSLILMAIGFAYVSKFSKAKSATIVVSVWAFWTAVKLGFVALGELMRARK
jgi:hypothetical protein